MFPDPPKLLRGFPVIGSFKAYEREKHHSRANNIYSIPSSPRYRVKKVPFSGKMLAFPFCPEIEARKYPRTPLGDGRRETPRHFCAKARGSKGISSPIRALFVMV